MRSEWIKVSLIERDRQWVNQGCRHLAPSRKDIELRLLKEPERPGIARSRRGVATWLSTGLSIEETQVALVVDMRKLGRKSTSIQKLEIARRKDRLQGQIDGFLRSASIYLGEEFDTDHADEEDIAGMNIIELSDDDSSGEYEDMPSISFSGSQSALETIPLPSNLGPVQCSHLKVDDLVSLEIELRKGQANDALQKLRLHLSHKAILFRTVVRNAKSQSKSTRAWSQVTSVGHAITTNASIYNHARMRMISLGVDEDVLRKYQPLLREHLKVTTAIADPNARGQRNDSLAWFWSVDVDEMSSKDDWMLECRRFLSMEGSGYWLSQTAVYRVHWLRAKALRDRWAEEMSLVRNEMDWTCNFFEHKSKEWEDREKSCDLDGRGGHKCYASRQSDMYKQLGEDARAAFQKIKMSPED